MDNIIRTLQKAILNRSPKDLLVNAYHSRTDNSYNSKIPLSAKSQNIVKLEEWKMATQVALDPENQNFAQLMSVYDSVTIDNHLTSIIESRVLKVLGAPFKIINDNGEENTQLTAVLEKPWFRDFLNHTMLSIFWGSCLIELIRDDQGVFKAVLIPRSNTQFVKKRIFLSQEDDKGIAYDKPPVANVVIEIGEWNNLGLLHKASPIAIAKKYAVGCWGTYTEKYGIPFRWVTTTSRDKKREEELNTVMHNLGAAASAVLQEGEKLEMLVDKSTNPHEVFDALISRANSELSKLALGQTMTTDDGSSKSQAEVHKEVADERFKADKAFIKNIVNEQLLPRLNLLEQVNFTGWHFSWDETEELSINQYIEAVDKLGKQFTIDHNQVTERTGITIVGYKQDNLGTELDSKKKANK